VEKKSSQLTAIGTILGQRVICRKQPVLTLLDLVQRWPEVAGERIAAEALPVRLKGTTLFIAVSSATWAQELQFLSPQLLAQLQDMCPQLPVKKLRFLVQ